MHQRLRRTVSPDLMLVLNTAADSFANEDPEAGVIQLVSFIRALGPEIDVNELARQLLDLCADDLETYGPQRTELLALALHVLVVGLQH
jgi:hypothetical protein